MRKNCIAFLYGTVEFFDIVNLKISGLISETIKFNWDNLREKILAEIQYIFNFVFQKMTIPEGYNLLSYIPYLKMIKKYTSQNFDKYSLILFQQILSQFVKYPNTKEIVELFEFILSNCDNKIPFMHLFCNSLIAKIFYMLKTNDYTSMVAILDKISKIISSKEVNKLSDIIYKSYQLLYNVAKSAIIKAVGNSEKCVLEMMKNILDIDKSFKNDMVLENYLIDYFCLHC